MTIPEPRQSPARYPRDDLPLSVWPTAQQPSRSQRRDRYIPESMAHPAKMLPAIARHAVRTFTAPGDLVADPMCGIGTTLVEAVYAGRHGLGVEYEQRWVDLAQANLALAAQHGATGSARVVHGDARHRLTELAADHAGKVRLLVTSPPYGASLHGRVTTTSGAQSRVCKRDYRYSRDRENLAHRSLDELLAGFSAILRAARPLLAPGGVVVITTRPFRRDGELIDFPSLALDAAIEAGLRPVQRCVALLAGLRNGQLVPRANFFHLHNVRALRDNGIPAAVVGHEDVLVLRRPSKPVVLSMGSVPWAAGNSAVDGSIEEAA